MRLALLCIGKLHQNELKRLCAHYQERILGLCRPLGFQSLAITELSESAAQEKDRRRLTEASALLAKVAEKDFVISFDERGEALSSPAFGALLAQARDMGFGTCTLILGGADGLHESVRTRAQNVVGFGAMTFPHGLARIMALEQIYRAMTLMANHPYHRG